MTGLGPECVSSRVALLLRLAEHIWVLSICIFLYISFIDMGSKVLVGGLLPLVRRGLPTWVLLVLAFSLAWNRIKPVRSSRVAVHSTFRVCCILPLLKFICALCRVWLEVCCRGMSTLCIMRSSPFSDKSHFLTKSFCGRSVRVCALHYFCEGSRECIKQLVW